MNLWQIAYVYTVSILAGGILAQNWVIYLRKKVEHDYDPAKERIVALDWSVGGIERAITTTLVILAPPLAPAFVGGWVVLKFAANWGKRSSEDDKKSQDKLAQKRLIALIGSAISLSVAVLAGLLANPDALTSLAKSN